MKNLPTLVLLQTFQIKEITSLSCGAYFCCINTKNFNDVVNFYCWGDNSFKKKKLKNLKKKIKKKIKIKKIKN
jgi:hypothetical protein